MVKLEAIMEILLQGALGTIRQHMALAPTTRYRAQVLSQIGAVMLEIERTRRITPALPVRTRALLLMPARPMADGVSTEAVHAYVRAVALGEPLATLAELVKATNQVELMRRFLRYVPGVERDEIAGLMTAAEVMLS